MVPETLEVTRRVVFSETDAAGIVHFSRYFVWIEDAEAELLQRQGLELFRELSDGTRTGFPKVEATCRYLSPVRFGDTVRIRIELAAPGTSSLSYTFQIRKERDQSLVAEGTLKTVYAIREIDGEMHAEPLPE